MFTDCILTVANKFIILFGLETKEISTDFVLNSYQYYMFTKWFTHMRVKML